MGIRTLHRRTAPAPANVDSQDTPSTKPPKVPFFAADASTARIPADLIAPLRRTAATVATLRARLALTRTALARWRPLRTVKLFVATARALSEQLDGSAPAPPHRHPHCPGAEPDATL
ncbi:hypothetical protein ACWHLZ_42165 [Streptomyces chartreusis]|uniref:hypothetical protein n=1 Tax=Streptomyces chartreusis TaxID=1969 RepID=UPI0033DD8F53|nr:hypothetical protein OG938_32890 [Streptomyces chartreusis]WTA26627.1 hypothetical protein OIA45_11675 [Streptomyces chartreusis]